MKNLDKSELDFVVGGGPCWCMKGYAFIIFETHGKLVCRTKCCNEIHEFVLLGWVKTHSKAERYAYEGVESCPA